jgi:hypothetical protein
MTLDELINNVACEPPQTITLSTSVLAPARLEAVKRKGGMLLTELLAGAPLGEPRTARYGHILGPPASAETLKVWRERFPHHPLPVDLQELVTHVNGIHLWADLATGRSYHGLAPLEEWDLARLKMFGEKADPHLLHDCYVAMSYHRDAGAFIVLNVDSQSYFLMDSAGPDESCPIGASTNKLLDWVWNHRIDPTRWAGG